MTAAELLLLQRWMLGAQMGTVALLALFFAILARTQPLAEVRLWAAAWTANTFAILAAFSAPLLAPAAAAERLLPALEVAAKLAFATLLLAGAHHHVQPGGGVRVSPATVLWVLVGLGALVALFRPDTSHLQLAQALMLGLLLGLGAVTVLRRPRAATAHWLGAALLALALYNLHWVPLRLPMLWGAGTGEPAHLYLRALLETGAETFVALASLVALQGTVVAHLQHLNRELEESQKLLRHLVEVDPLTGLRNRRGLRPFLAAACDTGATVIVLDVDNFKQVNDSFGHLVGDASLKRVAAALCACFRAEDGIFRWGGDEFLLVCPGLNLPTAQERVGELARLLSGSGPGMPPLQVTAGFAALPQGGEPERALQQADALLLEAKMRRRRG